MKKKIAIISCSVRDGRLSHRVSLFLRDLLNAHEDVEVDLIDLREYDFPIFHERLPYMKEPTPDVLDFASRITDADGIAVVSPVYNTSYPAALKNVIDLLVDEWNLKPLLIGSVTAGATAGITTAQQLQALFLKMGARVAAPTFTIINVGSEFSMEGAPAEPQRVERHFKTPVAEFMWLVEKSRDK